MKRPKINVTRSSMPPYEEYCAEIKDLWESRWLTNMGAKHRKLQDKLSQYLGAEHIDLLTNGHMAIELSLQALELHGEIITTPFTFASTTQAIVRSGLVPVFCDIDPVTFTMDPEKIEALITPRTCAIVPVHTYGTICDVEAIDRIAKKHGLKVVYDAAHAFGVRYKGRGIASYGDVSCFSFHATKVFHTVEGGAACFRDAVLGQRLTRLKNFGLVGSESVESLGGNAKLDEFRAAMGLCNLRYVNDEIEKRGYVVSRYCEHLNGIPGIQLRTMQPDVQMNNAYFPIVIDEDVFGVSRDFVKAALETHNIYSRKYFYPLTNTFACYQGRFNPGNTPIAQNISRQVLCLPLFANMTRDQTDQICEYVLACRR